MTRGQDHATRWRPRTPYTAAPLDGDSFPHRPPERAHGARPLTAAQVIGCFTGGGAERLALNLAAGLAESGTRSFAVAVRSVGLDTNAGPAGVEFAQFGAERDRRLATLRAMLRFRRFIEAEQIDIIHIHGKGSLPFCALATVGMRPRPRLVFTWHSPEFVLDDTGLSKRLLSWSLHRCDRVYGPSREIVERLTGRIRLRRPAEVFRNGVAGVREPAEDGRRGEAPVIVWAARLVPTKEPGLMLNAAATLRREGLRFRLVLAGAAPAGMKWFAEEIDRMVRDLGLADIVEMPGWLEDTSDLFRSATIAVQSSRAEGLSMSLLEQMMSGLAVVATDVGDTSDAVIDGRTGLLVPPGDEAALTGALRRLLRDPGLRARLARSAREYAVREFTLPRMAERASREYGELLCSG